MKARVIATGEIVEVMYSHTLYDIIWYITPRGACFSEEELELIDTGESLDYWTRLEHTYAGMVMQGTLANKDLLYSLCKDRGDCPVRVVATEFASACAHALVEKMKEK